MKIKFLIASLFLGLTFTACDKDDDKADPTTPTSSSSSSSNNNPISFNGADGTLIAVKSSTAAGPVTIDIGSAVAVFYNSGNLVDVGTVNAEGTDLTKNSNNSYTASASASSPMGISYTIPINWVVSGANGFASFSEDNNNNFPTASAVTSGATVSKSNGYTLSTSSISGADSVLFTIGSVNKVMSASTTSYTFSSSELSGLANGSNVVSIAPYNFYNKTISGKNIYFVNEYVVQKSVTIQN